MTIVSREQMIDAIAGKKGTWNLKSIVTLSVNDDNGELLGYCSGNMLDLFLRELLNEYLGPINQQRIQGLKKLQHAMQVEKRAVDLDEIVRACIDPLMDALSSKNGRMVHFCHRAILLESVDIDQRFWWTPALADLLKCCGKNARGSPGQIASGLNYMLYHMIGRTMKNNFYGFFDLPRDEQKVQNLHLWLSNVARAILSAAA